MVYYHNFIYENVYYGRLSDIEVTNSGEDYDVINPPELEIVDSQGTGCKAMLM